MGWVEGHLSQRGVNIHETEVQKIWPRSINIWKEWEAEKTVTKMCVYMRVCVCVCVSVFLCACLCVCVCVCVCVRLSLITVTYRYGKLRQLGSSMHYCYSCSPQWQCYSSNTACRQCSCWPYDPHVIVCLCCAMCLWICIFVSLCIRVFRNSRAAPRRQCWPYDALPGLF